MMRTLLGCLLVALLCLGSANRTSYNDILELEDGDDCPKGTWSPSGMHEVDIGECEQCFEGEYSSAVGNDMGCELCPAGSYAPDMGYWECVKCPAGQITTEDGNLECFSCGKGKHSPVEGGTECLACPQGHYQDEEGAAGCKVCAAGQYQDVAGATSCKLCSAGTSSPEQSGAADSCAPCSPGSYSPSQGSECLLCPVLKYQDLAGATSCKDCPANTDKEGATDCSISCPEGQVPVDGACKACEAGSYAPVGADSCTKCAKGFYSNTAGAGVCNKCPVKTYGPEEGMTECMACEGNDEEGMTECKIVCPAGQIVQEGKCVACPAGQYESQGQCLVCAAGTYSEKEGSVSCEGCEPGHYSLEGALQCEKCQEGEYQDKARAGYCEKCAAGKYNPNTAATECMKCDPGFFNPEQGQEACKVCPPGTVTEIEGQLSCLECDAGSYSISSSKCELCAAGHYSDDKAAECSPCAPGSYASDQGSSACTPSPAGYYVDTEGAVDAIICPEGFYCPERTVTPVDCPAGSYCPAASETPTSCPVGTYNPKTNIVSAAECTLCSAGSYCSDEGLTAPSGLCDAGYYCPGGSTTPTDKLSPEGHYCPAGSASPVPCPRSTYNELTGMTAASDCIACPDGTETAEEGATSEDQCKDVNCVPGYFRDPKSGCTPCPKGTYSNLENAVACRPCPRHQYNSEEGQVQCTKCPETAYTWDEGTDSLEGCVGPVIEVCTEEDMGGNCYRYYDNNVNVNTTIKSVQVISGDFELFDLSYFQGYRVMLSERHGAHNVAELGRLSNVRSFVAHLNDVFCSLDQGWRFHGSIRKTSKSGKACINWKRTPLAHKAAPNHFCQNPGELKSKPYCYISETETEECDIPSCVWDMDCYTGDGVHYRGKQSETEGGYTCQNWNRDYPVIHSYHSPEYNWAGVGEHTYCRNPSPGSEGRPWCFKDYFWSWFKIWEFCDIPRCTRDKFSFYKF